MILYVGTYKAMKSNLFRKCLVLTLILLLVGITITPNMAAVNHKPSVQINNQYFTRKESIVSRFQQSIQRHFCDLPYNGFNAEDITFKDACYNGSSTKIWRPFEWWYFDAVFDNNYSMEFSINHACIEGVGIIMPLLNIYKDGELLAHNEELLLPKEFIASKEKPLIILSGQQIITGHVDKSGNWIFDVSLQMEDCAIALRFSSVTQGWKSKILDMWWWGVIQPNAYVNGTISIHNETIPVKGTGYQEHVWDGTVPVVWGWFWGKFVSESMSIIWTDIFKNPWTQYIMIVLNQDNGSYINIPYEKIQFSMTNYTFNDGWLIPASFRLKVEDEEIQMDIKADTINIVHQTSFVSFNYWRYHVHVKGTISFNSTTENIDNVQIMDLTRFW